MIESWETMERLARARQRELLEAAATERLFASVRRESDLMRRVRFSLGSWIGRGLVELGSRLQEADRRHWANEELRRAS